MSSPIVPKGSLLLSLMAASLLLAAYGGNFYRDFDISWGNGRAKVLDNGQLLTLSLDRDLGSGFQSKSEYLFGKFDMQLKLVQGNSAGTVAAGYLQSRGPARDEIDFEFLGNLSGEPYTVHTNVYTQGRGDREQQFHLWFDPTKHFHTYSVLWNPRHIIFAVDGIPIRDFKNLEVTGVPFPNRQPMRLHCSLWNADEWATRGGLVKTDWSQAPFVASYRNFRAEACPTPPGCGTGAAWLNQQLDATSRRRLRWVRRRHMIYDYCADAKRFAQGPPPECARAAEGAGAF